MPSIEIVCVGQIEVSDFSHLPFAVKGGMTLKSDRSPRPLFEEEFDALKGCIYHLGNPELKTREKRIFFAADLLSDRSVHASRSTFLQFRPEFVPAVSELLASLIGSSPVNQMLFTSDYQFGPKRPLRSSPVTLSEFGRFTIHANCVSMVLFPSMSKLATAPRAPNCWTMAMIAVMFLAAVGTV
jgi:hypothetical protein